MDSRKMWVTGCSGFLGSRATRALVESGHSVAGISRRGCESATNSVSLDLASESAPAELRNLLRERGTPETLIHTAARIDRKPSTYPEYIRDNVLATANLLGALDDAPPSQIIYTSTLTVYSRPETVPVKETDSLRSDLPYATTKRWGEQLVQAFQDRSQVIILRLPSLYGAGQPDSFVDGFARLAMDNSLIELYSSGDLVRDALHVDDVVAAITACVEVPPAERFSCMNLGCGEPISTREYAQALVEALGSASTIVPVDRPSPQRYDLYADIQEARRKIGFTPTPLASSMKRYADELRAQP